jgi:PAS domain S-box-containing protein
VSDATLVARQSASPAKAGQVLWLTIGVALLLVAMAAAALLFFSHQLNVARTSYFEARHTRATLDQLHVVFSSLQDAETSAQGYVLTGSEEVLSPYFAAQRSLEGELDRLTQLANEGESRQIARELAALARAQFSFVSDVVAARRSQDAAAAVQLLRAGVSKSQMDRIRELTAALETHESELLAQRFSFFEHRFERNESVVRIALSAAIVMMLGASVLLVWHMQRRLRAERAAENTASMLRSTMENVSQGVAVFDSKQQLIAWNGRYVELRGLNPRQMHVGMSWTDVRAMGAKFVVSDQTGVHDPPGAPALMAASTSIDVEGSRADGAVLQVRGQPMSDGNYIVTYSDVTALKLSETAHRDQAARLSAILDGVLDAIVTINESGSIESWSRSAERLFGYTAAEVLRRNVRLLMPEPHSSAHDGYIRRYLQTGERRIVGQRREVEALHKDGRRIPVDLGISEMLIGSRRLFIGVIRDLSSREEIEQLKTGFVSTVSHELRTPLTSISGSLGLLAGGIAGALPAKAARLIDIAKLNCERLVRLINDILDLERAESGRLELRLAAQRLKPIVRQAIEANRAYAQTFGASIELAADSDDASVLVDRDRLIQVLTNILSNAAKFLAARIGSGGRHRPSSTARVSACAIAVGHRAEFRSRSSTLRPGRQLGLACQGRYGPRAVDRQDDHAASRRQHRFRQRAGRGHDVYITLPARQEVSTPVRAGVDVSARRLCCFAKTIQDLRARVAMCSKAPACGSPRSRACARRRSRWHRRGTMSHSSTCTWQMLTASSWSAICEPMTRRERCR